MCSKNWVHQANLVGATTFHKYSWSILTSFGIMVTAGYGPYNPGTLADCWIVLFSQAMGVAMFTLVGSMVTTILVHLNASSSEYASKMSALNQYMAHQKLPQVGYLSLVTVPPSVTCNRPPVDWQWAHAYCGTQNKLVTDYSLVVARLVWAENQPQNTWVSCNM